MAGRRKATRNKPEITPPEPAEEEIQGLPDPSLAPDAPDPLQASEGEPPPKRKRKPRKASATTREDADERREGKARRAAAEQVIRDLVVRGTQVACRQRLVAPAPDELTLGLAAATTAALDHYGLLEATGHPLLGLGLSVFALGAYLGTSERLPEEDAVGYYGPSVRAYYQDAEEQSTIHVVPDADSDAVG